MAPSGMEGVEKTAAAPTSLTLPFTPCPADESAPDAKRTKYCGFHAAMAKKGKAWGNHISEECRDKYKLYARHEEKTRNADKPNRITKHSHTKAKLGKNLTNLCFALRTLEK